MQTLHLQQGSEKTMIKITERTTQEIEQETIDLYDACRPLLEKGFTLYQAIRTVKRIPGSTNFGSQAWYKRFRDYALSQGYTPKR
jgi:hypothetical protein